MRLRQRIVTRDDVVRACTESPGLRAVDVARRLDLTVKAADAHLSRAVAADELARYGARGRYRYGPPGWTPPSAPMPPADLSIADLAAELAGVRSALASGRVREAYLVALLRAAGIDL